MTPQQHLKAALDKYGVQYSDDTFGDYIEDTYDMVESAVLEAMLAHTNEVLWELGKHINDQQVFAYSEYTAARDKITARIANTKLAVLDSIRSKIQSLKT